MADTAELPERETAVAGALEAMSDASTTQSQAQAGGPCTALAGQAPEQLPLVALLRAAKDSYTAEFDARLASSDFCALSLAHSRNVLRHLVAAPRRASQIVADCGVSKQALSQQIVQLESNGYLVARPDPTDQRARVLELTPRGRAAQQYVVDTFAAIEHDWARALGERDAASLRRVLTKLVGQQPSPVG